MRGHHTQQRLALILSALALAVAAGCGDGSDGGNSPTPTPTPTVSLTATPTPRPMDLATNLTGFEFGRFPALGFCPPLHTLFRATIERGDDAAYRFRPSILVPTGVDDADCIQMIFSETGCAREVALSERVLTNDEVEDVLASFQAVLVFDKPDPACEHVAFDPCLINGFTWTRAVGEVSSPDRVSLSASSDQCATLRLPPSEVDRLLALLGRLTGDFEHDDGEGFDARNQGDVSIGADPRG